MTSFVVVDAGFTFRSIVPNPWRNDLLQRLQAWQNEGRVMCAPSLWLYEITSIFTKMVHFGELVEEEALDGLKLALDLDMELITPNETLAHRAFAWTRRLSRAPAYDSFYLALAEAYDCELWTADRRLVNAAGQPWVRLAG